MSTPAVIWLAVGAGTTLVLGIVLVALVREGILVGRTVGRLARELGDARPPGADDDAGSPAPRR